MATNIPPHNLGEVVDATIALIQKPDMSPDHLLRYIKGPDFPTGGIVFAPDLAHAYGSGHGKVAVRARVELEESAKGRDQLVVKELPYQVNKARLLASIAELVNDRKLEGISGLRDESGRKEPVRVVIEVRRDAKW